IVIIAITFSYAIAGFIIDLIFLLSYIVIYLFYSTGLITTAVPAVADRLFGFNPFEAFSGLIGLSGPAGNTIDNMADGFFGQLNLEWLNAFDVASSLLGFIGTIIVSIAIIYALFRLMVQLLFAYLEIIFLTVLSPIFILPDILPGGGAFTGW